MARISYLGTCSGTEPMAGMHHCSFVLETGGRSYWFDAGECCAHTAYTGGIDLMRTEALFISHPHPDHTAGLPHLLFCMNKLCGRYKKRLVNENRLEIFLPDLRILEAVTYLAASGGRLCFDTVPHTVSDGPVFQNERLRVSALHNRHLGTKDGEDGVWHSFSYLIETEGRRILFSGDVKEPCELDALIGDGVDLLIMETGHHAVRDVCEYALSRPVGALCFNHHGREILEHREDAEEICRAYAARSGISIKLCCDGMQEEI